jgi:CRISPR-associated endonuclease/helicase Cas3
MMGPDFDYLLAKSYPDCAAGAAPPAYARLLPHLRFVEDAGRAIVDAVGKKVLRQLDLDPEVWLSRLQRALVVACLCHDIGKANDGFQRMVRNKIPPTQQPARHELLSALLLADEESSVRAWALGLLSENGKHTDAENLLECVIGAVGGHHLKLDEEWKKASIALRDGGCDTSLQMLLTHSELKNLFGESVTTEVCFSLIEGKPNSLKDWHLPFKFGSRSFKDRLRNDPEWWRLAAALKALTAAADVAGSALSPEKVTPHKWVRANLAETQFVTSDKMHEVVRARLEGKPLRPFQKAIAGSGKQITLVEAGCGTGKTAAAYAWAATHANGRKLFFCYPTTGTATEGYRDYVAETDVEADLMHSRADVDLNDLAEVLDDLAEVKADEDKEEKLIRIESLRAWSPQVIICTADMVLSLPRNNRRGLYNSPAILTGSFVFDELHAYDNRMFAAVIALIKAMPGAHFLLMTASLPPERKNFLLRNIPLSQLAEMPSPIELEELPRYRFQLLSDKNKTAAIIEEAVPEKKKVLWICNQVKRAQDVYNKLKAKGFPVETYHSRFNYEHRKERHRNIIDGFDRERSDAAFIAVTTQVAEMSLDLDADVLISEVAAVPSLIQRLGRLNRRITPENKGTPRPAYFYQLGDALPYREREIETALVWIEELEKLNRALNQIDLAESFKILPQEDDDNEPLNTRTNWLDSGWFAEPESVRDLGVSISIILDEDKVACRQSAKERINKAIPMNFDKRRMEGWPEFKGNLIAPPDAIDYDAERGARWKQ